MPYQLLLVVLFAGSLGIAVWLRRFELRTRIILALLTCALMILLTCWVLVAAGQIVVRFGN